MEDRSHAIKPAEQRPGDAKNELQLQYRIFCCIWALAAFVSAWQHVSADQTARCLQGLVCLSSLATLLFSARPAALVVLVISQLAAIGYQMPHITSAQTLWLLFGLTVLVSAASQVVLGRLRCFSLFRSAAPTLRMLLLLVLLARIVARVNWQFLEPESNPILLQLLAQWPNLGSATSIPWQYLVISAFIFVDLGIIVSLMIPRLRRFGVGMGAVYFGCLSYLGYADYQVMLAPFCVGMCLFTSMDLAHRIQRLVPSSLGMWLWNPRAIAVMTTLTGLLGVVLLIKDADTMDGWWTSDRTMIWYGGGLFLVGVLMMLGGLISPRSRITWVPIWSLNPLHYGVLILCFAAAASPYFGAGFSGRFTDFSGFSASGELNNHLWIPQFNIARAADYRAFAPSTDER